MRLHGSVTLPNKNCGFINSAKASRLFILLIIINAAAVVTGALEKVREEGGGEATSRSKGSHSVVCLW